MLTHSLYNFYNQDGSSHCRTHCRLKGEIFYWDYNAGRGELRTTDGVMTAVEHALVDKPYKIRGGLVRVDCVRNPNVTCRECIKRIAI